MKATIRGNVYDTNQAVQIGSYESSYALDDARYWRMDLYRKPTGHVFVHAIGNSESKTPGERIAVLAYLDWDLIQSLNVPVELRIGLPGCNPVTAPRRPESRPPDGSYRRA